jgi:hypothetical protein
MENERYRDDVEYIPLVPTGEPRLFRHQRFFATYRRSIFHVIFLAAGLALGLVLGGKIHRAPPLTVLENFHNMRVFAVLFVVSGSDVSLTVTACLPYLTQSLT